MLQAKQRRKADARPLFKVGDTVELEFVYQILKGKVVEDRGPIGIGGRRLYRVVTVSDELTRTFELPEVALRKVE